MLAFIGVCLIISQGHITQLFQQDTAKGDVLILLNAVVWAGVTLYGTTLMKKYRPFVAMAYIHIFGTMLLLPFAIIPNIFVEVSLVRQLSSLSLSTYLATVYLAVFCSVYSYFIWYVGVEKLGAVKTAVFSYCNPLFAVLTGIIWLNEILSWHIVVGGLLVVTGVYVTNRRQIETRKVC